MYTYAPTYMYTVLRVSDEEPALELDESSIYINVHVNLCLDTHLYVYTL